MDDFLCILVQIFKWVAALMVVKKIPFLFDILSVKVLSEPHAKQQNPNQKKSKLGTPYPPPKTRRV